MICIPQTRHEIKIKSKPASELFPHELGASAPERWTERDDRVYASGRAAGRDEALRVGIVVGALFAAVAAGIGWVIGGLG